MSETSKKNIWGDTMNVYLKSFQMPSPDEETNKFMYGPMKFKQPCYNNYYPFKTLPEYIRELNFAPITILYGANGSGKTTMLNLIAESLGIKRATRINKSSFMEDYIMLCEYVMSEEPTVLKIITSDDVFSNLFLTREKNEIIDKKREEVMEFHSKCNTPGVYIRDIMEEQIGDGNWIDNIDILQSVLDARGKTASRVAKSRVGGNIIGKSNGETAIDFFYSNVNEPGLYLLDEPENSLSALYQRELAVFLYESARFFGAQLVISTHSPFMLSIPGAKIYNLDDEESPVTEDWTSLENMRQYFQLFDKYRNFFTDKI